MTGVASTMKSLSKQADGSVCRIDKRQHRQSQKGSKQ
jgi:hypothetical protein